LPAVLEFFIFYLISYPENEFFKSVLEIQLYFLIFPKIIDA